MGSLEATTDASLGTILVDLHAESHDAIYHNGSLLPPPADPTGIRPTNAAIAWSKCSCGAKRVTITAATDIRRGAAIVAMPSTSQSIDCLVLAQFDGSCSGAGTNLAHGGCGVAIYIVRFGIAKLVRLQRHPLPSANSAALAEAHGLLQATAGAVDIRDALRLQGEAPAVLVQGDNAAAINFINREARIKAMSLLPTLERAWERVTTDAQDLLYEYIPRELNKVADNLAVQARVCARQLLGPGAVDPMPEIINATDPLADPIRCSDSNDFTLLPEFPRIAPQEFDAIRHRHHLLAAEIAPFAFPQMHKPGQIGRIARYNPKTSSGEGRRYVAGPSGQNISKKARYLLFGHHTEVDMSAAHPSLFVALAMAAKPGAKFRAMFPPHTLRDRIRNAFITGGGCLDNCYEAAERVFRAFLNVPPADILKIIAKTAIIFNPPIVTDLMRDVQEFGPVVDEQIRLASPPSMTPGSMRETVGISRWR